MSIDTWDVYVTENGETVVALLHGVSSIVYSTSLSGLVMTIMVLALLLIAIRFVFTGGWSGSMKWFLTSMIMLYAVVAPKKAVHVQDYSNPHLVGIVQDVPLGLAAILSFSTVAGDKLVQIFETAYGTVDGAGGATNGGFLYSTGGMLSAERTFAALMNSDAQDPRIISNVNNFLSSCVYPDIVRNNRFGELTQHENIPAYFSSVSSNSLVYYKPPTASGSGSPTWQSCVSIAPTIQAEILEEAEASIDRVGRILHPNVDAAEAASQYETDLNFTADRFLSISQTGPEMISQVMSINMVKRSLTQEADSGGEAALMDYVNAQASVQSRLTMSSIGGLMQTALPKMHSVLVIVLIAVFPIVFAMAFLPGGGGIIKNYFLFYLNLQVWPLMFSVFSRIIEGETAERAKAIASAAEGSSSGAVTMTTLDPLLQLPSETSAIAAMMIGLIPGIAVMLTKGYDAVASQVESTLRPINVATENAAAAGATGNINLKNANLDNSSVRNHTADQYKQSPSVDIGQFHGVTKTGAGFTVARSGQMIVQGHTAQGTGAMSASAGQYMDYSINKRAAEAESHRRTLSKAHGNSVAAATTDMMAATYAETDGKSFDFTKGHDVSESDRNTVRTLWADALRYAEENNLAGATELRDFLNTQRGFNLSAGYMWFGNGGTISGSRSTGKDKSESVRVQGLISDYLSREGNESQAREYASALNRIQSSRERDSTGKSLAQNQSSSANLNRAETFRDELVKAENNISSLETAANQSSGSRANLNVDVMGRAQRIVQEEYGGGEQGQRMVALAFGAAPGEAGFDIQESAIRRAINEQVGSMVVPHDAEVMKLAGVSGPAKGEADVVAAHSTNQAEVGTFAAQNQIHSDAEKAELAKPFEQQKAAHEARLQSGRDMKADVVRKQGGQDVMNAADSIESTTAHLTPTARAESQIERDEAVAAALEAQPSQTIEETAINYSPYGGMAGVHRVRREEKVPLSEEQLAAIPAAENGSLRDERGYYGESLSPSHGTFQNTTGVGLHGRLPGPITDTLADRPKEIKSHDEALDALMDKVPLPTNKVVVEPARNRGGPESGVVTSGAVDQTVELTDQELRQAAEAISEVMDSGVFARSVAENREYGGLVYRDVDGQIRATEAVAGFTDADGRLAFNPSDAEHLVPAGAEIIGDYHTHGRAGENQEYSGFSVADIQGINNDNDTNRAYAGGFLVNPQRDVLYYGADSLTGPISRSDIDAASQHVGSIGELSSGGLLLAGEAARSDSNFTARYQDGVLAPQDGGVYGFAARDLNTSIQNAFEGRAAALGKDGYFQFSNGDELIQLFKDNSPIDEAHIMSHGWSEGVIGRDMSGGEGFYIQDNGGNSPRAAYMDDFINGVRNRDIVLDNGASINFYGCNLDNLAKHMSSELSDIGRSDISVMGADASVGAYDTDGNRLDDTLRVWNPRNDNFNTYRDGEVVESKPEINFTDQGN